MSPLKQSALNYVVILLQIENYPSAFSLADFGSESLEPLGGRVRAG